MIVPQKLCIPDAPIPRQNFPGWEVIKAGTHIGSVDQVYDVIIGVDRNEPLEFRAVSNGFHAWLMQRRLTCKQWFKKLYLSTPKLLMP